MRTVQPIQAIEYDQVYKEVDPSVALHSFLMAVIINTLSQTWWFITTQIGGQMPKSSLTKVRLKSRDQQAVVPSGGPRGESVSLPVLASGDHLHSLAQDLFFKSL